MFLLFFIWNGWNISLLVRSIFRVLFQNLVQELKCRSNSELVIAFKSKRDLINRVCRLKELKERCLFREIHDDWRSIHTLFDVVRLNEPSDDLADELFPAFLDFCLELGEVLCLIIKTYNELYTGGCQDLKNQVRDRFVVNMKNQWWHEFFPRE